MSINIQELTIKEMIKNRAETLTDLALIKRKIAKKYLIPCPSNVELLKAYHKMVENKRLRKSGKIESLLRTRPIRSLSGIVNVSVLTSPRPQWGAGQALSCPGKCLYCPSQKGVPKSYLDNEPAVMRAILNKYDPYKQVQMRLEALKNTGHPTDKIELRIVGGTWSYYPKPYQNWFVKRCFEACNQKNSQSLEKAQNLNEKAKHRLVGLSIETRPDYINPSEIKRLRRLGVTGVELGVQSLYDDVLNLNQRGHKVKATIEATKLLKEAGFKICYQMMPNLPGTDLKRDEKMFQELFSNPDFQPDFLKIYPTAVLKEAPLYQWWKKGKYQPYSEKTLINLVKKIKKRIPYYVRIQRITRDIPGQSIVAGPTRLSNLRQIISGESKREGWQCQCVRCREVRENYNPKEKPVLFREDYSASNGKEVFLSFEDKNRNKLYSLLRLRFSNNPALENRAVIREVHTYGQQLPINQQGFQNISAQHRGLGRKLIKEAEKIAKKEFGLNRIAVISAIGTRPYYQKLGYQLEDTYMVKKLA